MYYVGFKKAELLGFGTVYTRVYENGKEFHTL